MNHHLIISYKPTLTNIHFVGFDFDSPYNQNLTSSGSFAFEEDDDKDSDSSLYSDREVSPIQENTYSVENGIPKEICVDTKLGGESGKDSTDIENKTIYKSSLVELVEPIQSHNRKASSGGNFYSRILNDT
jgi:hypothetical protein